MIEKVQHGIYRVRKRDMNKDADGVIGELTKQLKRDYTYMVCFSREDGKVNGYWARLKEVENDYRSNCLIVVK